MSALMFSIKQYLGELPSFIVKAVFVLHCVQKQELVKSFTIVNLANVFIQRDLQMRTIK